MTVKMVKLETSDDCAASASRVEAAEVDGDAGDDGGQGAEVGEHHAVPEPQLLVHRGGQQSDQRRAVGGDQQRDEDVGGVGGAELGAIDEDGGRDEGHPRGVDDQEQDLIVAGGVLLAG